jgi:hypothetical protein
MCFDMSFPFDIPLSNVNRDEAGLLPATDIATKYRLMDPASSS